MTLNWRWPWLMHWCKQGPPLQQQQQQQQGEQEEEVGRRRCCPWTGLLPGMAPGSCPPPLMWVGAAAGGLWHSSMQCVAAASAASDTLQQALERLVVCIEDCCR